MTHDPYGHLARLAAAYRAEPTKPLTMSLPDWTVGALARHAVRGAFAQFRAEGGTIEWLDFHKGWLFDTYYNISFTATPDLLYVFTEWMMSNSSDNN